MHACKYAIDYVEQRTASGAPKKTNKKKDSQHWGYRGFKQSGAARVRYVEDRVMTRKFAVLIDSPKDDPTDGVVRDNQGEVESV